MTTYALPYMAKINISPISWTGMLSYNSQKITSNLLGMNLKRSTSLFVFIMTFWTRISVFQKLQFIIPSWSTKKSISLCPELFGQVFTNLPWLYEKKICKKNEAEMVKLFKTKKLLNWEKIYKAERRGEKICLLASR